MEDVPFERNVRGGQKAKDKIRLLARITFGKRARAFFELGEALYRDKMVQDSPKRP